MCGCFPTLWPGYSLMCLWLLVSWEWGPGIQSLQSVRVLKTLWDPCPGWLEVMPLTVLLALPPFSSCRLRWIKWLCPTCSRPLNVGRRAGLPSAPATSKGAGGRPWFWPHQCVLYSSHILVAIERFHSAGCLDSLLFFPLCFVHSLMNHYNLFSKCCCRIVFPFGRGCDTQD